METLTANLAQNVRHERRNGREFIVSPVTLIVPGVLNGSQGALYYPPEEIKKNVQAWNGIPITLGHPKKNGKSQSARSPDVTNLGTIYSAEFQDKLKAEAWLDVEKIREAAPQLLPMIQRGTSGEVSTGLYTDNETVQENSEYNGTKYTHIARNYRPDHLAVLVDQQGACSVQDGCGLNVNFDPDQLRDEDGQWTAGGGKKRAGASSASEIDKSLGRDIDKFSAARAESAISSVLKDGPMGLHEIASATGIKAGVGQDPLKSPLNQALVKMRDSGRIKVKMSSSGFGEPWFRLVKNQSNQFGDSGMDEKQRKKIVDLLVNSCCWEEGDRETLNALTDTQLKRLRLKNEEEEQTTLALNAATKEFKVDPKLTVNELPEAFKKAAAAKTGDDEDVKKNKEKAAAARAAADRTENAPPKWEDIVPDEVKEDIAFARNEKARQKKEIAEKLVANVEERERPAQIERLMKRSLPDLQGDLALLPVKNEEKEEELAINYVGASGGKQEQGKKGPRPLADPTVNYSDLSPLSKKE